MSPTRLHADEIGIDVSMARRLVAEQVPEYAVVAAHVSRTCLRSWQPESRARATSSIVRWCGG